MEHYKISKVLKDLSASKFVAKQWIKVNDLSSSQHSDNKNMQFKTSVLRSDLCDFSDPYIVVKRSITVEENNDDKTKNKKLIFKNNAPFRSYISKINNNFLWAMQKILILLCQCIIC